MAVPFQDLVAYFKALAVEDLEHSGGTYLGHCAAVYRDMKKWGASEELARAGLFHSIYGTILFDRFALPLEKRQEVQELIGERAERLAYLNCAIEYDSFDRDVGEGGAPYRMLDRFTGETIKLSAQERADLLAIHLCDRLEQAPRSRDWEYRPKGFLRMARVLGGPAADAFDSVYARASVD